MTLARIGTPVYLLAALACSSRSPVRDAASTPPAPALASSAASTPPATAPAASAGAPSAPSTPTEAAPKGGCSGAEGGASGAAFTRVFEAPVSSFAVGKVPRAALISQNVAFTFDGGRFQPIEPALPECGGECRIEIFFGRDNEPRAMGYLGAASGGFESFYRRHKNRRWMRADAELGPLAGSQGGLYGVLGWDDPEVVCKPGARCVIKRLSGWTYASAQPRPTPIAVSRGRVFALEADRIDELAGTVWTELEPKRAWNRPRGVWAGTAELWVIESSGLVFRKAGSDWARVEAPIGPVTNVWGISDRDVWLVGPNGAAHFDGARFTCPPGTAGPLAFAFDDGAAHWLAGQSGVWRRSRAVSR